MNSNAVSPQLNDKDTIQTVKISSKHTSVQIPNTHHQVSMADVMDQQVMEVGGQDSPPKRESISIVSELMT